jgi:hypothetical protein
VYESIKRVAIQRQSHPRNPPTYVVGGVLREDGYSDGGKAISTVGFLFTLKNKELKLTPGTRRVRELRTRKGQIRITADPKVAREFVSMICTLGDFCEERYPTLAQFVKGGGRTSVLGAQQCRRGTAQEGGNNSRIRPWWSNFGCRSPVLAPRS